MNGCFGIPRYHITEPQADYFVVELAVVVSSLQIQNVALVDQTLPLFTDRPVDVRSLIQSEPSDR